MTIKIEIDLKKKVKFNFNRYINLMLSLVPNENLIGISKIKIIEKICSHENVRARYVPLDNGKMSEIEVNISTLNKEAIPKYLFDNLPEIAALLLSEYIFHEIGHHVHHFKKHGIKRNNFESFANTYARKGYLSYFNNRKSRILFSYFLASINFLMFDKHERKMFADGRKELIVSCNENHGGLS
jgi:hypothetical protein